MKKVTKPVFLKSNEQKGYCGLKFYCSFLITSLNCILDIYEKVDFQIWNLVIVFLNVVSYNNFIHWVCYIRYVFVVGRRNKRQIQLEALALSYRAPLLKN